MPDPVTGRVGYCTNVHAGTSLAQVLEGLATHAVAVRRALGWDELGLGLWLSNEAAEELAEREDRLALRDALANLGLFVYTLNGFPYGDFHGDVVKHAVYEPAWGDQRRLDYTIRLAEILADLLPEGGSGSISTLPIGWPDRRVDVGAAVQDLYSMAYALEHVAFDTGRRVHLDLEPEPGCLLQRSADVVRFFEDELLRGADSGEEAVLRSGIGVCHDACHAAVMYESQRDVLDRYRAAGINVGKAQLSSAVRATAGPESLEQLRAFAEDRYLHQTVVRADGIERFFDDLPAALASGIDDGEWRVHFHVPVDIESFGALRTTQGDLEACIALLRDEPTQLEIETYAWSVLPEPLQPPSLAEGIAREITWVRERLDGAPGDSE